jgi:hypothetical protein
MESELGNDFFSGKHEKNSYMMMLMRLMRLSAVFSRPYVNDVMAFTVYCVFVVNLKSLRFLYVFI